MTSPAPYTFEIIGDSAPMRKAIERLQSVAPTDLAVLITGESGTGKEVFARAIHQQSPRHKYRLVSVNCGALPENLLEAELFGNEKGAYTGAVEQRKGFFEAAHKGTIFLDEIGEMPVGTQVKLLRVLETGEFSRLGSSDTLYTDVRIIAATNRRLEDEVARGTFRRDLYYRLNTVQIMLPALREHPEDIPLLVQYFARRTAEKLQIRFAGISEDALRMLSNLPWTGNIRELRNMLETLVTLEKGQYLTIETLRKYIPPMLPEHTNGVALHTSAVTEMYNVLEAETIPQPGHALVHLPGKTSEQVERELLYKAIVNMAEEIRVLRGEIGQIKEILLGKLPVNPDTATVTDSLLPVYHTSAFAEETSLRLQEAEQRLIVAALERSQGNRRLAAVELGISERTLYRKLHEYNLLDRFSQ